MITREQIEDLIRFDTGGMPVVSFYLYIGGRDRSMRQCIEVTHQLLRSLRADVEDRALQEAMHQSVLEDIDRIIRHVGVDLEPGGHQGLAIFSSSRAGLWKTHLLSSYVTDTVQMAPGPYIRPLARLLSEHPTCGVVLVNREKARLFRLNTGELIPLVEIEDDVHASIHPSSWYGLADKRIEGHIQNQILNHLRHAARALEEAVKREHLERIVVLGTAEMLPQFLQVLSSYLSERVIGHEDHTPFNLSTAEIIRRAEAIISQAKQHEDEGLVRNIYDAASPGGFGMIGLEETLEALSCNALRTLVVDRDLEAVGFVCGACGRLFSKYGPCPQCGSRNVNLTENLIEAVIEGALRQGADVEFVSSIRSWAKGGGIGGLLRFRPQELSRSRG